MLQWVLWAWWNLMSISNESMDFNDPKELNDPNYSMIPSYSMINWKYGLIQKSTVIPPSLMVLYLFCANLSLPSSGRPSSPNFPLLCLFVFRPASATFSYSSQLFSFLMFPWKRKFPPPSTFCFFLSLCKYFPSSSWAKLCVSRVIWSAFSLHELLIQRCLEQNNFCQGLECKISHGQRKIKEMKRFKSKRIIDFKC